jgi:hypothetical protein
MKRPKDLADRSRELRDVSGLGSDGSLRETFTLPLLAARLEARQIIDEYPAGGYMTIVENWRQLPNGQIEFTMRRLPTTN